MLLAVARSLGEPVGYVQEHGGGLVQDIVPDRANEGRQLSTSSSVVLEWHTETAFHPHKPRYLLLLCLRGDPAARTMLCSIAHVLPHLDPATIAILREARFRTRPDASFLEEGTVGELGPPMTVVTGNAAELTFTYDEDLMVGTDAAAQAALDRLGRAVRAHATAVVLEAGDLLVIDNHRVVHGRSPFHAAFRRTRPLAATHVRRLGSGAVDRGAHRTHHHDPVLTRRVSARTVTRDRSISELGDESLREQIETAVPAFEVPPPHVHGPLRFQAHSRPASDVRPQQQLDRDRPHEERAAQPAGRTPRAAAQRSGLFQREPARDAQATIPSGAPPPFVQAGEPRGCQRDHAIERRVERRGARLELCNRPAVVPR